MYKVGDCVFALVRGHKPWPATISEVETKGKIACFKVSFFGPKKFEGLCTLSKLFSFEENKSKYCSGKIMENNDFLESIKEADSFLKNKKNGNRCNSSSLSTSFTSSTPKTPTQNKNQAISDHRSSSNKFSHTGVNTTIELDQTFQLDAITDRCIDLEKKLLESEEKCSALIKAENLLKIENESLKISNLALEENLKKIADHDTEKQSPQNFQTQILLQELKNLKLEKDSLTKVTQILNDEKSLLLKKVEELNISDGKCLRCFPPMQPSVVPSSSWTQVNHSRRINKRTAHVPNQVCLTKNFYESLADNEEEGEGDEDLSNNLLIEEQTRILICGDSHGRDLSWHLNKERKTNKAVGFIKPGGRTREVLNHKNIEEENLKENDVLVILSGANDVAKNEAKEAIEGITGTIDKFSHMKVVLVDIPNRYDLKNWSCVNREIKQTNTNLKELCNQHSNVLLVEASSAERHLHTRQGLHLNRMGKKWLAENIARAISTWSEPRPQDQRQPPPPGEDTISDPATQQQSNISGNSQPAVQLQTP